MLILKSQNDTASQLLKVRRKLAYLYRQYARVKNLERKQDTRRKIQLGGLIKKAGLDGESTAVLYGLLLEAQEKINQTDGEKYREAFRLRGDLSLTLENKS